jgi:hypothetical protein
VNTIKKYAADKNLACFDWFAVSGGYGSMGKWYAAGMADRARIHYTRKGYEIQGKLMLKALLMAYDEYELNRDKK